MMQFNQSKSSSRALGHLLLLAVLGLGLGCGGDPDDPMVGADAGVLDPDADPGPPYEDADWLFVPETLLTIDIDLQANDWDLIRFQTRNILELFGETCAVAPAVSPFYYVPATVTVNGMTVADVGVRKKGFLGSLDDDKPSLKIKFDEYVDQQTLTGLDRMTLNNAKQDPSHMNQCLGYGVFRRAGIPAPRCNFAHVSINGASLGIYVHVESVAKPFLNQHFASKEGNLYEGTLSDFRAGWTATFDRKTNKADPPGTEDRSDILALTEAMTLGDSAMLTRVEELIDLESFFRFWAVETMTAHWDGYSGNNNNFFVYGDPTTSKMTFMPWGNDQLFGIPPTEPLNPAATKSILPNRLYLYGASRARYLAAYEEILDNVWDDSELLAEIDRYDALIRSYIPTEQAANYADALTGVRSLITGREAAMRQGLAAASPADVQSVSGPLCFSEHGNISGSFDVAYGTNAPATLSITLGGTTLSLSSIGSAAAPDEDNPAQSVVYLAAQIAGGRSVIVVVYMPTEDVAAGNFEVGAGDIEGFLAFFPVGGGDPDEFYILSGDLTLSQASATPGGRWVGSVNLVAWQTPFF